MEPMPFKKTKDSQYYMIFAAKTRRLLNTRNHACHVDWPRSFSANETSIPKPSEYLFDRHLYLYGEFVADRSRPVSPLIPPLPFDPREYTMTTSGHECLIVRLPVEHMTAPCSDLSYATTGSSFILIECA
ncbi:Uncharacterized protein Fot_11370 [Forsythia ovata]|uniref:Uncharacterized protein n=1 Tax=Forsythia ovata TaxID=205694 RepID=A0ABD1WJH5_9LAMI